MAFLGVLMNLLAKIPWKKIFVYGMEFLKDIFKTNVGNMIENSFSSTDDNTESKKTRQLQKEVEEMRLKEERNAEEIRNLKLKMEKYEQREAERNRQLEELRLKIERNRN